jgi:hypothetical protein
VAQLTGIQLPSEVDFMSEFIKLEANAPATLGAVVEALTHLSTFSEAQILELVSAGRIKELFQFRPNGLDELPADTVAESDLEEASAMPLSRERRAALVQASMPSRSSASVKGAQAISRGDKKTYSKG